MPIVASESSSPTCGPALVLVALGATLLLRDRTDAPLDADADHEFADVIYLPRKSPQAA